MPAVHSHCEAAAQDLIELVKSLTIPNNKDGATSSDDGFEAQILTAVQALLSVVNPTDRLYAAFHDGKTHYPLGGGSYAFQKDLVGPLLRALAQDEETMKLREASSSSDAPSLETPVPTCPIVIHAGAQPNNSPHLGTLIVFCYVFLIARAVRDRLDAVAPSKSSQNVVVEITFVDTAPVITSVSEVGGITYQRSYREVAGALSTYMGDYQDALRRMSQWSGVPFQTRFQSDLFSHPAVPGILAWVIEHRGRLASQLSPKYNALALRAACPVLGCGLAEKHGRLNEYTAESIAFHCPHHGKHVIRLSEASEVARVEANAPTRNLIRSMSHILDDAKHHVRITGSDYAGTYQEFFLYRPLAEWSRSTRLGSGRTPHILYAPLVVDWSGAKLSKSLYVRDGGYRAMKVLGMDGACSYAKLQAEHGEEGLRRIWAEVESWVSNPHKLFRASYSVEYFRGILEGNAWH
ncbi:hypothetical protein BBO_09582 [Beauveria brongniartii RCEF 3172]|uniref:Uncharacterized protein n=1 Tax=Beauveria brongniartii RCEF 3172 TaxID=1081107 RepID=A0A162IDZ2_9HYPO|nr:hypothetical protein BBO_09582 [Beauveria brongniartii RCEF 3172]